MPIDTSLVIEYLSLGLGVSGVVLSLSYPQSIANRLRMAIGSNSKSVEELTKSVNQNMEAMAQKVDENVQAISQKVDSTPEGKQREALLAQIKRSSMAAWHHIYMDGEYDFSDERINVQTS